MDFFSLDTKKTVLCEEVPDHTSYVFKSGVLSGYSVSIAYESAQSDAVKQSIHSNNVPSSGVVSACVCRREDFGALSPWKSLSVPTSYCSDPKSISFPI